MTETISRLETLAADLAARGWPSRIHEAPGRLPSLHVRNPEPGAGALAEYVYAQARAEGSWLYWWSWAEPIADAPAAAAAIIVRVLRSAGTP